MNIAYPGLCFVITPEHFTVAPDGRCSTCYILLSVKKKTKKKKGDICHLTLNSPSSCSTALACWHIQRREHRLSQGMSSAGEGPVFICVFPPRHRDHLGTEISFISVTTMESRRFSELPPKKKKNIFFPHLNECIYSCTRESVFAKPRVFFPHPLIYLNQSHQYKLSMCQGYIDIPFPDHNS